MYFTFRFHTAPSEKRTYVYLLNKLYLCVAKILRSIIVLSLFVYCMSLMIQLKDKNLINFINSLTWNGHVLSRNVSEFAYENYPHNKAKSVKCKS